MLLRVDIHPIIADMLNAVHTFGGVTEREDANPLNCDPNVQQYGGLEPRTIGIESHKLLKHFVHGRRDKVFHR